MCLSMFLSAFGARGAGGCVWGLLGEEGVKVKVYVCAAGGRVAEKPINAVTPIKGESGEKEMRGEKKKKGVGEE